MESPKVIEPKEIPDVVKQFFRINEEIIRPAIQKKKDEYEKKHGIVDEPESLGSGATNNNK
jgi:hypothetical protein